MVWWAGLLRLQPSCRHEVWPLFCSFLFRKCCAGVAFTVVSNVGACSMCYRIRRQELLCCRAVATEQTDCLDCLETKLHSAPSRSKAASLQQGRKETMHESSKRPEVPGQQKILILKLAEYFAKVCGSASLRPYTRCHCRERSDRENRPDQPTRPSSLANKRQYHRNPGAPG